MIRLLINLFRRRLLTSPTRADIQREWLKNNTMTEYRWQWPSKKL